MIEDLLIVRWVRWLVDRVAGGNGRGDRELSDVDSVGFGDADELERNPATHAVAESHDRKPPVVLRRREFLERSRRNLGERTQWCFRCAILAARVLHDRDTESVAECF